MGYVSKDFVHEGCGLPLEPENVWDSIPYSVQKNINKAERNGVIVKKVAGSEEDISILKGMWYDPEDPNMPNKLSENEHMFIAYDKSGEALGATILLPVGNHLFLNNLAGNTLGKRLRVQDYLLWHCVNHFENSEFKYIDVGVSYRPSLYRFFKKWQVMSYPVIFNVPDIKVEIPLYPFSHSIYKRISENQHEHTIEYLKHNQKLDKITFVPNEEYAKKILLEYQIEPVDMTYNLPSITNNDVCYIDLKKIFPVQFGVLLFGLEIDDKEMWNKFGCLDIFKREYILDAIFSDLKNIDGLIEKRGENFNRLAEYFASEDIHPLNLKYDIPDMFVFEHEQNQRYSAKLTEFGINHFYDNDKTVGLPIHQELSSSQIEYLYAIFRGVLNLCSEWEHTDKYDNYKS